MHARNGGKKKELAAICWSDAISSLIVRRSPCLLQVTAATMVVTSMLHKEEILNHVTACTFQDLCLNNE